MKWEYIENLPDNVEVDYLDLAQGVLIQALEDCRADEIDVVSDTLAWLENEDPEFIFGYWFICKALGISFEVAEHVRVLAIEKAKETLAELKSRSPTGFLF